MKLAILGYGKMGKEIEKIALERGHTVPLKISSKNLEDFSKENLENCDVAIDFTTPDLAVGNIYKCFEANLPIVVGTTGWYANFDEVVENYSRYKKLTKNFVSMEENDLVIKAIYYIAQLKIAPKNQYEKKLNSVLQTLKSNPHLNNNLLLVERVMEF